MCGHQAPVQICLAFYSLQSIFNSVRTSINSTIYSLFATLLIGFVLISCTEAAITPTPNSIEVTTVVTATPEAAPPTATSVPPATAPPITSGCVRGALRTEDEIVIGTLYPLSNPSMMANGLAMQAATNLAVAAINEQGGIDGKPLRIVVYDSGSNPAQAALFAQRMITLDCVIAIVGVFHSNVALAVKDIAVQYHVPVLFADPYADEVTAIQSNEVFRIAPTYSMLISMMGKWLQAVGDYNQDGDIFAVVLAENTPYGQERLQRIQEELPPMGINSTGFLVDLPATDFSPIIARIVALDKSPDVIFLYLHNGEVIPLLKQLIDAGISPERNTLLVATSQLLDDVQFWQQVPNGNFVIAMQVGPWPSTVTPFGQTFAQEFNQYFQRWPEASAFEAYDAMWILSDAIARADSLAPDAVIGALERTNLTLASGHYTFPYGSLNPPNGNDIPAYMWHQWPNPQILYLQYTEPNQPATQMEVIWPPLYRSTDAPLAPQLLERNALSSHHQ